MKYVKTKTKTRMMQKREYGLFDLKSISNLRNRKIQDKFFPFSQILITLNIHPIWTILVFIVFEGLDKLGLVSLLHRFRLSQIFMKNNG